MKSTIVAALGAILFGISTFASTVPAQVDICTDCASRAELTASTGKIIGDFIRNADGSVKTNISQIEASRVCEGLGSRLPTIRELAEEAVKLQKGKGPNGVDGVALLDCNPNQQGCSIPLGFAKSDFYQFVSINSDKSEDHFFYSKVNFKRPEGDLGQYWTSSSSLYSGDSVAHLFVGFTGGIGNSSRSYHSDDGAARCVAGSAVFW